MIHKIHVGLLCGETNKNIIWLWIQEDHLKRKIKAKLYTVSTVDEEKYHKKPWHHLEKYIIIYSIYSNIIYAKSFILNNFKNYEEDRQIIFKKNLLTPDNWFNKKLSYNKFIDKHIYIQLYITQIVQINISRYKWIFITMIDILPLNNSWKKLGWSIRYVLRNYKDKCLFYSLRRSGCTP